ncbi:Protein of unknown function [Parasphingorhabdus marina DSM 22363]|uniref:DUF3667 domain-containing protein n=1 Tax=Parasphingorhabdus marina DSM 22363 TaxID=1123272 RepID=A0A1N6CLZ7_9SPHN|nr:DUF3667 domain-containing protein [Parasphingorhabdus marina]SIN59496.1 Protein of unknown function [Parasphingorhabdus marina DSM 22363]
MSEEIEAVGAAVTGTAMAKAVEDDTGSLAEGGAGACLNCGSQVTGNYCSACGQPLHVHRSIGAFWHDILHGVLHFEGKLWRTLPLLAWRPGELTRRYIHGQRARFISPMALFLFSVFMMFAVFSFVSDPFGSDDISVADQAIDAEIAEQMERAEEQLAIKNAELAEASEEDRPGLEKEILDLKKARNVMATVNGEDLPFPDVSLADGDARIGNYTPEEVREIESRIGDIREGNILTSDSDVSTGSPEMDAFLKDTFNNVVENPDLLLYKIKANGYKFAWLLIPISLPFVWLTTIGRRGYHFYDHAVFTTYSISFMSLLFITCALLATFGVTDAIWGVLLIFYPPFHMYRQLRHAYQMSRVEALIRLMALLFFTVTCLILFFTILLALGLLG